MMKRMKSIPLTRKEFERNMYVLVEKIRNKQHFFSKGSGQVNSLLKVKELPNKRINFLTVNESARLQANHIASMMDMDFDSLIHERDEYQDTK